MGLGPVSASVEVSTSQGLVDVATVRQLNQVIRHLRPEAVHFTQKNLSRDKWIYFDLNMGYGTSYRDSGAPPAIDDVALFYGSSNEIAMDRQEPLDLLLCGSTEHLLARTASAGRMGSGTEWLHDLIEDIEAADALSTGELPQSAGSDALAAYHINKPEQAARWVFEVIKGYHSPDQYAQLQGLARILLVVPETKYCTRLVLATPLFVQFASARPIGLLARRRLQRGLSRRHGLMWRKWRPGLAPEDRGKINIPRSERGKEISGRSRRVEKD